MAPQKSPKARRADLIQKLELGVAKSGGALDSDMLAKIKEKAFLAIKPDVAEAPDGFYNKYNTTSLLSMAHLVADGLPLEGTLGERWHAAIESGAVVIVTKPDNPTWRNGDIVVNGTHVVRRGTQFVHVFRQGAERDGNSVDRMIADLL